MFPTFLPKDISTTSFNCKSESLIVPPYIYIILVSLLFMIKLFNFLFYMSNSIFFNSRYLSLTDS